MNHAFFIILFFTGFSSISCNRTGAGKVLPAPVVRDTSTVETVDVVPEDASCDTLTVALTGDIMMGTTYPDTVLPSDDGRRLFRDVAGILRRADIAVGNLEGTLCDSSEMTKKVSEYTYAFRTPVRFAPRLKEAGYDFLSMANNHSFDFGMEGVLSTEEALEGQGIAYSGIIGRRRYAVVERGGVKYGICAFGHNSHTLRHQNLGVVKAVLDSLQAKADIIIVSFHGGAEGVAMSHLPYGKEKFLNEDRGSLRQFARFCIDNGADIVYGHGPHVVRCIEVYKGRFIAYSLGNFCTPYGINITGISGYAPVIEAKMNRSGRFVGGRIHSFIQKRGLGPRKDTTEVVVRQIKRLTDEDMPGGKVKISRSGKISVDFGY